MTLCKTRLTAAGIAILLSITLATPGQAEPVVGSYYAANGTPQEIPQLPGDKLTHILYAFLALCGDNSGAGETTRKALSKACNGKQDFEAVLINGDQTIADLTAFKQLKHKHPHLVLLPSFGGWTLSQPFHDMALKDEYRQRFVRSALALVEHHQVFDGIDIDWEFPGGGGATQPSLSGAAAEREKRAFRLLMKELRAGLDKLSQRTGKTYQLTAAVNGNAEKTSAIDWRNTAPHMDYVFAMTYDFAVGNGQANHHTNLLSVKGGNLSAEAMIDNLMNAGVPAAKLVLGVAFYGRGWTQSSWQGNRFTPQNNAVSTGSYTYKDLMASPPEGFSPGYDKNAEAAYLFNPKTNSFISYDSVRSVTAKANWARQKGLGGIFSWQIRQDDGSLLDTMHEHIRDN